MIEATAFMVPTHRYNELNGPWLERAFYNEVRAHNVSFDRNYVAGCWTDFYGNRGRPEPVLAFLRSLPPQGDYFTLIQHCRGFHGEWPKNLLVFSAGGVGDVPIPLLVPSLTPNFTDRCRKHRISFMGNFKGAHDLTGARSKMMNALMGCPDFHPLPFGSFAAYCQSLRESVFVLCPRGYGRTSFRLYETLAMNSIPVYIWDDVEWLPYRDVLDWPSFAISLNVGRIAELPEILGSLDEPTIRQMQEAGRAVYADYFTIPGLVTQIQRMVVSRA